MGTGISICIIKVVCQLIYTWGRLYKKVIKVNYS
jgi:hypothetical protein